MNSMLGSISIQKTAGVCGGEACIGQRRIAVWMLVNARRRGLSDHEIMNRYDPVLSTEELQAAWDYAKHHIDEIDNAIRQNEAD